jgi:hypothetical protein
MMPSLDEVGWTHHFGITLRHELIINRQRPTNRGDCGSQVRPDSNREVVWRDAAVVNYN